MNPLEFYRQFMGPKDTVFDIGAHTGERTRVFAELAKKVVAVDPITIPHLAPFMNVEFCAAALGSNSGEHREIFYRPGGENIASTSPEWIKAMLESDRFHNHENHWLQSKIVPVLTLDYLIAQEGLPSFIKIDVEGSELEVLKGLSQPVKALSFEWHPETLKLTVDCLDRCYGLGMKNFAISEGETFELTDWMNVCETIERLQRYYGNTVFGDVYARLP